MLDPESVRARLLADTEHGPHTYRCPPHDPARLYQVWRIAQAMPGIAAIIHYRAWNDERNNTVYVTDDQGRRVPRERLIKVEVSRFTPPTPEEIEEMQERMKRDQ